MVESCPRNTVRVRAAQEVFTDREDCRRKGGQQGSHEASVAFIISVTGPDNPS